MRPAILSHPPPLLMVPSPPHFHYDCLFSFFIIPCCQRHFQVTSTNLYRLSSLPPLPFPDPPLVKALKHVRIPISVVFPEIVAFRKFTFTISWIFTNLHICWSSFLLGVIISFDTLLGERRRSRRRAPLKWGVKCHWQVWAYRLRCGSVIIGVCVRKTSTLISDSQKVE